MSILSCPISTEEEIFIELSKGRSQDWDAEDSRDQWPYYSLCIIIVLLGVNSLFHPWLFFYVFNFFLFNLELKLIARFLQLESAVLFKTH